MRERILQWLNNPEEQEHLVDVCDLKNCFAEHKDHFVGYGKMFYSLYIETMTGPLGIQQPTLGGFAHFTWSIFRNPDMDKGLLTPLRDWISGQSTQCKENAKEAVDIFATRLAKRIWENGTEKAN